MQTATTTKKQSFFWTITAKADRKSLSHISNFTEEIKQEQRIDISVFLRPAVQLLSEMHYKNFKQ